MNNLPQRKVIRLQAYDYSRNGAYFVTICTHGRAHILSQICRGGALLRPCPCLCPIGQIAETEIENLSSRYNISVDKYVIMPNHIHMILMIGVNPAPSEPATCELAEQSPAPTISDIICTFKSISTKLANRYDNIPGRQIWQRSYHDRIIRDDAEYQKTWKYIDTNPLQWELDDLYEP